MQETHGGIIRQSLSGAGLIILCVIVGFLIANLIDKLRPQTFLQGRDFHRVAFLVALLITCCGLWWHRMYEPRVGMMFAVLIPTEVTIALLIVIFSGSSSLDPFFRDWFLGISTYIALPWLAAIALGFVLARGL